MRILPEFGQYNVGDVVYEPRGLFGPRLQTNLQLVYVHFGEAHLIGPAEELFAPAETAFFMLPGEEYSIEFHREMRTRHGWVDALDHRKLSPSEHAELQGAGAFALTECMVSLAESARKIPDHGSLVHQSIGRAIFEAAFASAGLAESRHLPLPPAVQRALDCMQERYPEPLDLSTIARESAISKAHLVRLFRESQGITPIRRLWEVRIEEASRLLRETGLSIKEIAERCGFPSPYHFSRLIKQTHGLPPRDYRRSHWRG